MSDRLATKLPFTELEVAGPYDATNHLGGFDYNRAKIDRIVIHTMVGSWQSAAERFKDLSSNVAAHYGVKEDAA